MEGMQSCLDCLQEHDTKKIAEALRLCAELLSSHQLGKSLLDEALQCAGSEGQESSALNTQLGEARQTIRSLQGELAETKRLLADAIKEKEAGRQALTQALARHEEDDRASQALILTLKQDAQAAWSARDAEKATNQQLQERVGQLAEQAADLKLRASGLEKASSRTEELAKRLEESRQSNTALQAAIQEKTQALAEMKQRLTHALSRAKAAEEQCSTQQGQLEKQKQTITRLKGQSGVTAATQQKQADIQSKLQQSASEKEHLLKQREQDSSQMKALQQKIARQRETIKNLREQFLSVQSMLHKLQALPQLAGLSVDEFVAEMDSLCNRVQTL